jgi:hypothetical protein
VFMRSLVTINVPSGWVSVTATGATGGASRHRVMARIADGSEGSTVSVTLGSSNRMVAVSARISGFQEGSVADVIYGVSSAVDVNSKNPPSASIPGGWAAGAENGFFAVFSQNQSAWTFTSPPTNYGTITSERNAISTTNTRHQIGAAFRLLTADTEDPGAFTISADTDVQCASTIIVRGIGATDEINSTTKIQDGHPLTISGLGFGATQSLGSVVLSPALDRNDAGAVIQTVGTWSDSSIYIAAAELPTGLSAGDTVYVYVDDDEGTTLDPLTTVVADPTLRLDGLLRDIDTDALITQDPMELIVLDGVAGGRDLEYNTTSGVCTAGVVEIDDTLYSVTTMGGTRWVIAVQSETRASVPVPATVVDRNDD